MNNDSLKKMTPEQNKAVDKLPGAAYSAENESSKTTRKKVDGYTKELNNNPLNEGKII